MFGLAVFFWVILRATGVLDAWALLTIMLVSFGLATMYDVGVRHELGWILIGAGGFLQISLLDGFAPDVRAGLWIAYVITGLGIMYQRGSLKPRRTVRLRGWQDSHVPLTQTRSELHARGNIRRGEIVCRFRRVVVDLTQAEVDRPPAILDVMCVAGRVDLVVPADWAVGHNVSTTLGRAGLEVRSIGRNAGPNPSTWVGRMRPVGERVQGYRDIAEPDPDAGFVHLLVQGSALLSTFRVRRA